MPPTPKFLLQTNARIDARARALTRQVHRWLLRFARLAADEAIQEIGGDVRKAFAKASERELELELKRILTTFGLSQAQDAGNEMLGGKDKDRWVIPPTMLREIIDAKTVQVQGIMASSRGAVRAQLRNILSEASGEVPRPTVGEISRRIRLSAFGPLDAEGQGRLTEFTAERAETIARTELAQTENHAIAESLEVAGIEAKEWLAFNDGKTGDRKHNKMDGMIVPTGTAFISPLGNRLRFPGDPRAPIKDTINCRCTVRPATIENVNAPGVGAAK